MKVKSHTVPFLIANLQYQPAFDPASVPVCPTGLEVAPVHTEDDVHGIVAQHRCRTTFAETISDILSKQLKLEDAKAALNHAIEMVRASPARHAESVKALLEDMCGQSSEALSRQDFWGKWGVHYLPSI